jgi:ankyrin repeat protein
MVGDVASLKSLVSSGMSPNARDENGNTPLTIALVNNQYEAADYLVSIGSRLDERNNLGKTVIQAVQSTRHSERDQAWLKKHEAIKQKQ